jgi:tripartite-type tricarboxylate transporter receptor subunit TctC
MSISLSGRIAKAVLCAGAVVAMAGTAAAQSPEQFFRGKTITVFVGFGPGGGYDFYARLFAKYAGKFIPGQPNVVTQNMPGAGSLVATNYVYNIAPKDGTALGIVAQSLATDEALNSPGVKYKSGQFNWIGRMSSSVDMMIGWHTAKAQNINDIFQHETLIAGTGPGSDTEVVPHVLNKVVGTKFKLITGYTGANEAMLALQRNEVEAATVGWNTVATTKRDWLKDKTINLILQLAPYRGKVNPTIPNMVELGKTEEQKEILSVYASAATIGRSIFGAPGIPDDRVAVLRQAFSTLTKDKDFLNEIETTGTEFDPMEGAELQRVVSEASSLSPEIRAKAAAARD